MRLREMWFLAWVCCALFAPSSALLLLPCSRRPSSTLPQTSRNHCARSSLQKRHTTPFPRHRVSTRLAASQDPQNKPRVKFAGRQASSTQATVSGLDSILAFWTGDVGSLVLGVIGLILLVGGRLMLDTDATVEDFGQTTRANLLAMLAVCAVALNGLTKLDVSAALAEPVQLQGITVDPMTLDDSLKDDENLSWVLSSLIAATPADTAVLLERKDDRWIPVALSGTVPTSLAQKSVTSQNFPIQTPILDRFLKENQAETYLPTLQVLPGKLELLPYLAGNTQAALLLPVKNSVLLLGSNQARSFTPRDIAWCQAVLTRLK